MVFRIFQKYVLLHFHREKNQMFDFQFILNPSAVTTTDKYLR